MIRIQSHMIPAVLATVALLVGCQAEPPGYRDGQLPSGSTGAYLSIATCNLPPGTSPQYKQNPNHAIAAPDGLVVDTQFCFPLWATFTDGAVVPCVSTPAPNDNDECDQREAAVKQYVDPKNKKAIDNVKPNLRVHLKTLTGMINVDVSADGKSYGFLGFIDKDNERSLAPANTDFDCFAKLTTHASGIYADLYLDRCLTTSRANEVSYLKLTQHTINNVIKGYARIDAVEALTFRKSVK